MSQEYYVKDIKEMLKQWKLSPDTLDLMDEHSLFDMFAFPNPGIPVVSVTMKALKTSEAYWFKGNITEYV